MVKGVMVVAPKSKQKRKKEKEIKKDFKYVQTLIIDGYRFTFYLQKPPSIIPHLLRPSPVARHLLTSYLLKTTSRWLSQVSLHRRNVHYESNALEL